MSGTDGSGASPVDEGGTWSGPVSDDKDTGSDTQDAPIEDMHETSLDEKLEGIVAQTRSDLATHGEQDVALLVRRRLEDSGIAASDDDVQRIVDRVRDVGDDTRTEPGVHPDR